MRTITDDTWKLCLLESVLRPIVRILLRLRITFVGFLEIAKRTYLDEAARSLEERYPDRNINLTELTFESGVPLADVKASLELSASDESSTPIFTSAEAAVIHTWRYDPRFLKDSSEPSVLPLTTDDGTPCFRDLVKRATKSNVGYRDMLSRLVRAECVHLDAAKEQAGLLVKAYSAQALTSVEDLLPQLAESAICFLSTLEHNTRGPGSKKMCEMRAFTRFSRPGAIDFLENLARQYYADIFSRADQFEDASRPSDGRAVGIGLYVFERQVDSPQFAAPDLEADRNGQ